MIAKYCKKLRYKRQIVLVTNGKGPMDLDGMDTIAEKISEEGIELVILYANPTINSAAFYI